MKTIQITPELLMEKAQEVRSLREDHDQIMAKLSSIIMNLNEQWRGEAQDAFVAKYESMQSTFRNFSEMLEDYAALMDKAARELQLTDQSIGDRISGM